MDDEPTRGCPAITLAVGASSIGDAADGHPKLSTEGRNSLAERIALTDGITSGEAHRHIDELMQCDLKGL